VQLAAGPRPQRQPGLFMDSWIQPRWWSMPSTWAVTASHRPTHRGGGADLPGLLPGSLGEVGQIGKANGYLQRKSGIQRLKVTAQ